jgi:hypothetical protein
MTDLRYQEGHPMHPHWLFGARRQHEFHAQRDINGLGRAGSYAACAAASIASILLIFAAASMNAGYAWQLGLAHSEFRAYVLAGASIGAAVLAPLSLLAAGYAVRQWRLGRAAVALALGIGCVFYTGVSSLGFTAGARATLVSEHVAEVEEHADRRAVAEAARAELASLASVRTANRAVVERRRELAALLVPTAPGKRAKPVEKDTQAAGVAFVLTALGWKVDVADVGQWLNVGMVAFLECAAALSLTVAAALRPTHPVAPPAAGIQHPSREPAKPETAASKPAARRRHEKDDDPPPTAKPKGKPGRPATVLPAQAVERLRRAGGKVNGTVKAVGKVLGTRSKTTAHRTLHQLQSLGLIQMETGPKGVSIALAS